MLTSSAIWNQFALKAVVKEIKRGEKDEEAESLIINGS
jgi:hypothetical protein